MAAINSAMGLDVIDGREGGAQHDWVVTTEGGGRRHYRGAIEARAAAAKTGDANQVVHERQLRERDSLPHLSADRTAELLGVREPGLIDAVQRGMLYRKVPGPQGWSRAEIDRLSHSAWLHANRKWMSDEHLSRHLSFIGALRECTDPAWAARAACRRTRRCERQVHIYSEAGRRPGHLAAGGSVTIAEQACSCGAARAVVRSKGLLGHVIAIRRVADGAFDEDSTP